MSLEEFSKVSRLFISGMEEGSVKRIASEMAWDRSQGDTNKSFQDFVDAHHQGKILRDLWFRFFP